MSVNTIVSSFSPPGYATDLDDAGKAGWNEVINYMVEEGKKGREFDDDENPTYRILNNAPRPQFFNPRTTQKAPDLTEKTISWTAFPRQVKISTPTDQARWAKADSSRDVQDEYCEWSVKRNSGGKITSVTFTAEGPEYWRFLGQTNPNKVLELYQKHISPNVKKEDLFDNNGHYIARNKWNRDTKNGAMHLIQRNNTLFAEVELAAGSSMVREVDGQILTEQRELIECGQYGAPERNSDPLIGFEVNKLTRAGAMVSLRDPVGLYIGSFNPVGWVTPDASDPKDYWKITRGTQDTALRAVFEIPQEKGFTVSDIEINGNPIEYGAQITDFIEIKLVGIAQNIGTTPVTKFGCVDYVQLPSGGPTPLSAPADSLSIEISGAAVVPEATNNILSFLKRDKSSYRSEFTGKP